MKKILWLIFTIVCSTQLMASAKKQVFTTSGAKEIELKIPVGDISLVGKEVANSTVEVEFVKWNDSCKLEVENRSGEFELSIKNHKSGFFNNSNCEVKVTGIVPRISEVECEVGSGNVRYSGGIDSFETVIGSGNFIYNEGKQQLT